MHEYSEYENIKINIEKKINKHKNKNKTSKKQHEQLKKIKRRKIDKMQEKENYFVKTRRKIKIRK